MQDNLWTTVGLWKGGVLELVKPVVFPSKDGKGTQTVPSARVPEPEDKRKVEKDKDSTLTVVLAVLITFLFLLVLCLVVLYVLRWRRARKVLQSAPTGQVTVVFTDIQSSSALWDALPEVMSRSLVIHNNLIRQLKKRYRGYEIKTIGDSFMLAFPTSKDAINFSCVLQQEMMKMEFPEDLYYEDSCRTVYSNDGQVLWKGLRVRVGMQVGNPNIEYDYKTNTVDYFGPSVNEAARVESKAIGGQVVISDEVLDVVMADETLRSQLIVRSHGIYSLKGISRAMRLHAVCYEELAGREFSMVQEVRCDRCGGNNMTCPRCDGDAIPSRKTRRRRSNKSNTNTTKSKVVSDSSSVYNSSSV
eukprot:NODE_729_length_1483_cov_110.353556_g602_i0.p1 GENE.NODE_729_length_1483_cov_110.353556_g602_i0~~NODE_729_length_1483_cov_110.353556_g602_i0.p1  ORF type:complete len:397 (-),score=131.91 NODE_729_length_1483_cov_110.353556_g602_i0:291-1367(-)